MTPLSDLGLVNSYPGNLESHIPDSTRRILQVKRDVFLYICFDAFFLARGRRYWGAPLWSIVDCTRVGELLWCVVVQQVLLVPE